MKRTLSVWLVIFIVWSIYRFSFFFPEWIDELIIKPLVFLAPIGYVLKKEKRTGQGSVLKKAIFLLICIWGFFWAFCLP